MPDPLPDPETTTLAEAWDLMLPLMEYGDCEGTRCLLCGGHLQVFYRNLGKEVARVVLRLHRWDAAHPGEWAFLPRLGITGSAGYRGDYAWGRHWGLMVRHPDPREDGYKHSGWWKITDLGNAWAASAAKPEPERLKLKRYVRTFRENAIGPPYELTERGKIMPDVSITDALGEPFDYDRFMAGEG